ncbi:MAG: hypothetical protein KKB81_08135 [Candidatus Margulisbacteria bacterium]|nr:hypothetical protein [Candidatus Margulisiibacteriota bacterium]MBU1021736.1 hypothetical protein [Candidatus Margulisiibacteriota bacterium]MBU1729482.1 hypothetical protein [Candidatus Margulisiibacteriota bacterium]MBU1955417.1 hypothetical protein [Candidatus Margulisiibacteriota bacterium]
MGAPLIATVGKRTYTLNHDIIKEKIELSVEEGNNEEVYIIKPQSDMYYAHVTSPQETTLEEQDAQEEGSDLPNDFSWVEYQAWQNLYSLLQANAEDVKFVAGNRERLQILYTNFVRMALNNPREAVPFDQEPIRFCSERGAMQTKIFGSYPETRQECIDAILAENPLIEE